MRKRFWMPLVTIAFAALVFYRVVPAYMESGMNRIDGQPLIEVSPEALALHQSFNVVDLHSDTLMWDRELTEKSNRGHEDLPRLVKGNVALQVFSSVSKTPKGLNYDANSSDSDVLPALLIAQGQPRKTWFSPFERSLYHSHKLDVSVSLSNGMLRKVTNRYGLDQLLAARAAPGGPVGALLSIEGLQNLEGKIGNLDKLYEAGFRMAGLTHFFDNEVAGSMHGMQKGGLTPLGRQVVTRMEDLGMIVDVAHCSRQCVAEVLKMARRPVVSSHGGVQAVCKVNRNLNDDEIRGISRTGGVIAIGYWDAAVCDTSPRSIARSIKYVRDLVGIDFVALGSDYDGATTVRFDTSHLAQITQALLDEGFRPEEIRAVMGGNALRVIRQGMLPYAEWRKDYKRG
ncbi:dipeptidase [Novosphingobium sp.]|uniref:dipeptidase n=1 Tax=Novosphingobium sp. TaxID=1874826 RepID=UPI0025E7D6A2|nr:dipeptidase [Novosphingobium sp.]MCC6927078.1 dipeptidase [Novosphingobium sp.]